MRRTAIFIGEDNKINNELYQLLNWRFEVVCYFRSDIQIDEISILDVQLVIVSMVGKKNDYMQLFTDFQDKCPELPIVTISTRSESVAYEKFYETKQFRRILRPVTGRRILEVCCALADGDDADMCDLPIQDVGKKQHILVVDDNAMVLRNIKGVLESAYSVAVAPSGIHAFISIGKKMPNLILLDYEMPEMNGKEVLKKIREQKEYADIPVVFLTSMDSCETVMELLALKPAGYILKPADSQMLLERIEGIIGK